MQRPKPSPSIRICGVRIDPLSLGNAVNFALRPAPEPCFVVTPNATMLDAAAHDPAFADLLNRASLSLPDGNGVLWAARKHGTPIPARVAGIDFAEALLARAAEEGLRVFFLGGREGVAATAAYRLSRRFPKLSVVGTYWGYFDRFGEENLRVIELLNSLRPDLLFVCLGSPAQEFWIRDSLPLLRSVRVAVGLGGSFDVWAGQTRRAPAVFRKTGTEWAYRMLREPRRLTGINALVRFYLYEGRRIPRQN